MAVVGRVGEALARRINRRTTIKKASVALFGAVAAWSVEGIGRNRALADHCAYITAGDCSCNPPYGTFCAQIDESYCAGSTCANGCTFDESWRYVGGCWCSATCSYTGDDGSPISGYYRCCDCNCYGTQCSCREFVPNGSSTHDDGSDNLVSPPPPDGSPPQDRPRRRDDRGDGGIVPEPGGGFEFPSGFPFEDD